MERAEEEAERVRRDVCAYKERNLSGFENVPVEEENVPGSWVVVAEEEVEVTWILLLQLVGPQHLSDTNRRTNKKIKSGCKSSVERTRNGTRYHVP